MSYQFTSEQLTKLLGWAISSYREYIDQHGKDEDTAAACAIGEIFAGMSAERELLEDGVSLEPSFALVADECIFCGGTGVCYHCLLRNDYLGQYRYADTQSDSAGDSAGNPQ
jgi:hypothetical protein